MCRYSTISLSATECDQIRLGEVAHVYTKCYWWLCRDSRGHTPCSNQSPKEEQIGTDVGSRQGACPVCDKITSAEYEYKQAVERATEEYNKTVNNAWQRKEDGINNSNYVEETFPYRVRRPRYSW